MQNPKRTETLRLAALLAVGGLLVAAGCTRAPSRDPAAVTAPTPAITQPAAAGAVVVARNPTDLPPTVRRAAPETVVVNLETVELNGQLAEGRTFAYWTFNGTVPGPMIRVRVGDTVELHLKNHPKSQNIHSIDLHAVTGPGGGAGATAVKTGEEQVLRFKLLQPGVYVYHCGSPHVPTHIAMGMYGLIVVEPAGGLPTVDREFYVMQGEFYTAGDRHAKGHLAYDGDKLFHEDPNYVFFNGQFQALTGERAMKARTVERIRLFIGNAGPNLTSSIHVIGEIFDVVHKEGATETISNVQTTLVPVGGATMVEFTVEVPGDYILVDHSISRAIDKGAVAIITVAGPPAPEIFNPAP